MKQKANEFMIGLFVTLATLIVILGILWLGRSNFFVKGLHIHFIVPNAQGLNVGDDVFFRGLGIGTVQSADLIPDGVKFDLKLTRNVHIPRDSKFSIKEASLLGGKAVYIQPGRQSEYLTDGAVVRGEEVAGLSSVLQQSGSLQKQIKHILANIESLTGEQTATDLQSILKLLNSAVKDFHSLVRSNQREVASLISNLNEISGKNKEPVNHLISRLSERADALSETITRTQRVSAQLDTILSQLRVGRGSLGKLLKDDSLYMNMNSSFSQLDSLLKDIRKNPGKYFEVKVF